MRVAFYQSLLRLSNCFIFSWIKAISYLRCRRSANYLFLSKNIKIRDYGGFEFAAIFGFIGRSNALLLHEAWRVSSGNLSTENGGSEEIFWMQRSWIVWHWSLVSWDWRVWWVSHKIFWFLNIFRLYFSIFTKTLILILC